MIGTTLSLALLSALPLFAEGRPLKPIRRTTPVKRLTWTQANDYSGSGFFDGFTTYVGTDASLTGGQVDYVSDSSLQYVNSAGQAILKVDNTTDLASGANRNSSRITSNAAVNENSLVIGDFEHVPYGCATWPAFWMVGPDWPSGGEIDIFEGVNLVTQNQMTLHTSPGCTHDTSQAETGTALQTDCDSSVNGNAGCGVQDANTDSYGDAFNNAGGGVWATQWDSDGISIWFFSRPNVPSDITSGSPDPTGWSTPSAFWSFDTGDCSTSFFNNLQIVFDITLCGDWAGAVYSDTCGSSTCSGEVESGGNFNDAYFQVNSVVTYTGS